LCQDIPSSNPADQRDEDVWETIGVTEERNTSPPLPLKMLRLRRHNSKLASWSRRCRLKKYRTLLLLRSWQLRSLLT
jgi:predicted RNA-binding protein with PUA-like domain